MEFETYTKSLSGAADDFKRYSKQLAQLESDLYQIRRSLFDITGIDDQIKQIGKAELELEYYGQIMGSMSNIMEYTVSCYKNCEKSLVGITPRITSVIRNRKVTGRIYDWDVVSRREKVVVITPPPQKTRIKKILKIIQKVNLFDGNDKKN